MVWDFKTIDDSENLIDLDEEQERRIGLYAKSLESAAASEVASPKYSNYFVKEGIGTASAGVVDGGNMEYGMCQALHGEECAVSAWRSSGGWAGENDGLVLGIITGVPGIAAGPCGNCRDFLRDSIDSDFEIVSGTEDGGVAVVVPFGMYLFDKYGEPEELPQHFENNLRKAISDGERHAFDPYSPPGLHPERKYYASLVTPTETFTGSISLRCEYHPTYPIEDAIRGAEKHSNPFMDYVIIASKGNIPDVMYRDRQHLLELNLDAEILKDKLLDPKVYLVDYGMEDSKLVLNSVMGTTVKEWLPMPFSPRNFGEEFMDGILKPYVGRRYRK